MIRLIIFFYGLSLFQFLSAQELICPPDVTRICHENLNDVPQIINGAGLNLQSSREFTGDNCQLRNVINTFSLVDLSNCLLYTSPSPRDATLSRMPSSA